LRSLIGKPGACRQVKQSAINTVPKGMLRWAFRRVDWRMKQGTHMDESCKAIETLDSRDQPPARQEWRRPEWRKLDAREAQAGLNVNPDSNLAS
jgi:hypothetical protein